MNWSPGKATSSEKSGAPPMFGVSIGSDPIIWLLMKVRSPEVTQPARRNEVALPRALLGIRISTPVVTFSGSPKLPPLNMPAVLSPNWVGLPLTQRIGP